MCIYVYIYITYIRIHMGVPGSEMWPRTRGLNPCCLFCRYRPLYRRGPGYTVVPSGSLCVYYERELIERKLIQMERVWCILLQSHPFWEPDKICRERIYGERVYSDGVCCILLYRCSFWEPVCICKESVYGDRECIQIELIAYYCTLVPSGSLYVTSTMISSHTHTHSHTHSRI